MGPPISHRVSLIDLLIRASSPSLRRLDRTGEGEEENEEDEEEVHSTCLLFLECFPMTANLMPPGTNQRLELRVDLSLMHQTVLTLCPESPGREKKSGQNPTGQESKFTPAPEVVKALFKSCKSNQGAHTIRMRGHKTSPTHLISKKIATTRSNVMKQK